jgi:hypothetical protein
MGDGSFIGGTLRRASTSPRRRATVLLAQVALLFAVAAAGAPASARAYSITPQCESPPGTELPDCSGWHTADVRLTWDWEPKPETENSGCDTRQLDTDSTPAGFSEGCLVKWDSVTLQATVIIRVDKTPPVITGAAPARPPDYNGWWTHPVDLTFAASDVSSGVAGCDTVNYLGPDGGSVHVSGSCRDVAGNSAIATQLLNYDATPPTVGGLAILRDGASALLGWQTSPDVVRNEVVRSLATDGAASTKVYSGSASAFSDLMLSRDVTYRYTVTAFDAAGNAASTTAVSEPAGGFQQLASSSLRPLDGTRLSRPPLLRWKHVRRARYYNVQLFRHGRKILSAWPSRNELELRRSWRYGGERRHLTRGWFRWYVWPGRGSRAERDYGKLIGSSRFFFRG